MVDIVGASPGINPTCFPCTLVVCLGIDDITDTAHPLHTLIIILCNRLRSNSIMIMMYNYTQCKKTSPTLK